jgi:hypothetical protein
MRTYTDVIVDATGALVETAFHLGIEPDADKIAALVARSMFRNIEPEVLREIREVAIGCIEVMHAIEKAEVLA